MQLRFECNQEGVCIQTNGQPIANTRGSTRSSPSALARPSDITPAWSESMRPLWRALPSAKLPRVSCSIDDSAIALRIINDGAHFSLRSSTARWKATISVCAVDHRKNPVARAHARQQAVDEGAVTLAQQAGLVEEHQVEAARVPGGLVGGEDLQRAPGAFGAPRRRQGTSGPRPGPALGGCEASRSSPDDAPLRTPSGSPHVGITRPPSGSCVIGQGCAPDHRFADVSHWA